MRNIWEMNITILLLNQELLFYVITKPLFIYVCIYEKNGWAPSHGDAHNNDVRKFNFLDMHMHVDFLSFGLCSYSNFAAKLVVEELTVWMES